MIKPVEEIRIGAGFLQLLARHRMSRRARPIEHQMHIDEDLVGILGLGEALYLEPKVRMLHAGDVRDEAALLQIAPRQCAIEIIDDRGPERFTDALA